MRKLKLLIVEDEQAILQGLCDLFVFKGYDVDSRSDGNEGLQAALNNQYDCIILDIMLPGLDGFSICEKIREQSLDQPIVILTAKNSEEDIINGLSLGADDYIAKPFSVRELVLRISSLMRRANKHFTDESILLSQQKIVDVQTLTMQSNDEIIKFTRREFDMLQYMFHHRNNVVTRSQLLQEIWGYKRPDEIDTRTVDIHIAKIRRKIEDDPKKPQILVTLRGDGYRLVTEDSQ